MSRSGLVIYLLAMLCAVTVIVVRFAEGVPLETDILALLPTLDEAGWMQEAQGIQQTRGANQLVVLVGNTDFDQAAAAARLLTALLLHNGVINTPATQSVENAEFNRQLFMYRAGFLSADDRKRLMAGAGQEIATRALTQILSPLSIMNGDLIRQDPLLLFPNFMASHQGPAQKLQPKGGLLAVESNGEWYVLVRGTLQQSAFDQTFQQQTVRAFENALVEINAQFTGTKIFKTGAVFYGEHAYRQAKMETRFIGGLSLSGIIFLNLLLFRSFQPLLLSLLAIASGITGGIAVSLLFFGKLHLFALVFGAGLIGISVDYAFHYFCERFQSNVPPPSLRAKAIESGLTLGLVSSVLGFLTLSLTPFPGLRQIALFSASGLTMAYICVLYVFPHIDRSTAFVQSTRSLNFAMAIHQFWWRSELRFFQLLVIVLLCGVGIYGATKIQLDDDVRRLQSLPIQLQAEERLIRKIAGVDNETRHFFVRGTTTEEALQTEESIISTLDRFKVEGILEGYHALSQLIPSTQRQQENRALLSRTLIPKLGAHMETIGLASTSPYPLEGGVFKPDDAARLPAYLTRRLILNTPGMVVHSIALSGVKDTVPLMALAESSENLMLVNHADDLSKVFGIYRHKALIMLVVAYVLVWIFLSLGYGPLGSLQAILPSLGAVLLVPGFIALAGETFTFFNAMSLILVFAIGLDYALFSREADKKRKPRAMLANGLSALSTILAFGLLALSDTYAIHAFGITILVGIVLAYCLAPLASNNAQAQQE